MGWSQFRTLVAIVNDEIYVGSSADDLDSELKNNTWLISMSKDERNKLSVDALVNFFDHVVENRLLQLRSMARMHFYVWHDHQASQLRFSLISDFHKSLPFQSKIIKTPLNVIVSNFLKSEALIPDDNLNISEVSQENIWETVEDEFHLEVYYRHLL